MTLTQKREPRNSLSAQSVSRARFHPDTSRIQVTNATFLSTIFCCAYFNAHKQQSAEYQLPQAMPTVLAPTLPLQTRTLSLTTDCSTDRRSIYRRPPHIPGAVTLPPLAIPLLPIRLHGVVTRLPLPINWPSASAHVNADTDNPHMRQSALGWFRSSTERRRKTKACTAPSVVIRDIHDSSSVPSTNIWNLPSSWNRQPRFKFMFRTALFYT